MVVQYKGFDLGESIGGMRRAAQDVRGMIKDPSREEDQRRREQEQDERAKKAEERAEAQERRNQTQWEVEQRARNQAATRRDTAHEYYMQEYLPYNLALQRDLRSALPANAMAAQYIQYLGTMSGGGLASPTLRFQGMNGYVPPPAAPAAPAGGAQ